MLAGNATVPVTCSKSSASSAGNDGGARARRQGVLLALDLSATTFRRIYLNYAWAFGYNLLMVPLAAGALYPPLRFQLPPWVRAPAGPGGASAAPAARPPPCPTLRCGRARRPA